MLHRAKLTFPVRLFIPDEFSFRMKRFFESNLIAVTLDKIVKKIKTKPISMLYYCKPVSVE